MKTLKAEKFRGFTDLPLYNRGTEWLKTCQNFRVMPSGYLEARQGFQELIPSGGTGADPISAGIYTGAHEHTMADGFIYTYEATGGTYTGNLAQRGQFTIWLSTGEAINDAIYVGSTLGKFSRVVFYIGQALTWTGTDGAFAYEYATAAAWDTDGATNSGTFTLTTTPDFETTGEQVLEVQDPGAAWVPAVRNGIYAYWIRIRATSVGDSGITAACRQGGTGTTVAPQKVFCDWPGARQIYVASADPTNGAGNGTLKYYGQTSGTQVAWQSVSTSLFSGNYPYTRFASYRNLLYFVNGKEQKRWDGNTLADIGFTAPDIDTDAATAFASGTAALGNGTWAYAMTYGYGPNGEWGESGHTAIGSSVTTVAGANDGVRLTWSLNSPSAAVECIYIYRTQNLASAQSTGQAAFPYYRIATIYRTAAGALPEDDATADYTDETLALPFPPVDLNVATRTPPARCKFVGVHKNRLFLGGNNQYPGRVWWSEPFEAEAFLTDENFADFTRSTGGQLTGMIEFADQMVCFTEDKMFGIANVDQDQPSIYEIAVVGCIAPDSIAASDGSLMWLGRNGVYRWTGDGLPVRVSNDTSVTFGKMSLETHGGSRCVIHNRMYETYLVKNDRTKLSSPRFRYDLVTDSWGAILPGSNIDSSIGPIVVASAPLGHADAGVRHPIYGVLVESGSDFQIYVGEYTASDAGSSFTCRASVHFGPPLYRILRPDTAYCVYSKGSGFDTPTLTITNASMIGPVPTIQSAGPTDGASDYSLTAYAFSDPQSGSADYVISFDMASVTGTDPIVAGGEGVFLAMYFDADVLDQPQGFQESGAGF